MKGLDFAQIGKRIKETRNLRNMSQESLANAVNVNVSHISNIETNKVKKLSDSPGKYLQRA
ncbi:helix-turn-helix domain-containing protein [Butyrivibrio sp. WCE2006]|uniref:helix-turn-helix domain-containing protein n=1 Tax=Butyrivibrio sp. WCE2006 TaxID=1410611 RepID=UPI000AF1B137|nr:helix-turn-helix transcriptional regulator [Butyrivibrio sp. WCE2006]